MPKPKPDQVIRHEIVLGSVERDIIDTAVTAYSANRVAQPLVALLSDNTALIALFTILEATGLIDVIPDELLELIIDGGLTTLKEAEDKWYELKAIALEVENAARVAAGLNPLTPVPMPPLVRLGLAGAFIKRELKL